MIGGPEQALASTSLTSRLGTLFMFTVLAVERKASEFVALLCTDGEVAYAIRHEVMTSIACVDTIMNFIWKNFFITLQFSAL
jgi:hypothetical protein